MLPQLALMRIPSNLPSLQYKWLHPGNGARRVPAWLPLHCAARVCRRPHASGAPLAMLPTRHFSTPLETASAQSDFKALLPVDTGSGLSLCGAPPCDLPTPKVTPLSRPNGVIPAGPRVQPIRHQRQERRRGAEEYGHGLLEIIVERRGPHHQQSWQSATSEHHIRPTPSTLRVPESLFPPRGDGRSP